MEFFVFPRVQESVIATNCQQVEMPIHRTPEQACGIMLPALEVKNTPMFEACNSKKFVGK
jgi:hypothetical protein